MRLFKPDALFYPVDYEFPFLLFGLVNRIETSEFAIRLRSESGKFLLCVFNVVLWLKIHQILMRVAQLTFAGSV